MRLTLHCSGDSVKLQLDSISWAAHRRIRVHYLMHALFETPGSIEFWVKNRGHAYSGTHTYQGHALPNSEEIDLLIVMGGPQSPLREGDLSYLRGEINLVAQLIEQNKPVVGVCLGAQLIVEALGATTLRSPEKEVGIFPVQLTREGMLDPILRTLPAEFDVLHWHHDMPGIPKRAVLLARSAGCAHQAFRFNDRVYGFQFHLEPTPESIKLLIQNAGDDLMPSKYTQAAQHILSADFAAMNKYLVHVLDSLVAIAQAPCRGDDTDESEKVSLCK